MDGLEQRLRTEGKSDELPDAHSPTSQDTGSDSKSNNASLPQSRPLLEIAPNPTPTADQLMSPVEPLQSPSIVPDLLLDTFFARIHGKPYHVLDEATTRQRLQANQLPTFLAYAIYAVSARYVNQIA